MSTLGSLEDQARELIKLGMLEGSSITAAELTMRARELTLARQDDALLIVDLPVSALAKYMRRGDKEGFVSSTMADVDMFLPVSSDMPKASVYAIDAPVRDDALAGYSPEVASERLEKMGVAPLTLTEGIFWMIQDENAVVPGLGFMTLGSRMIRENGTMDARVPGIWLAGGSGKDEAGRSGCPKIAWCWWRNVHSWLTFAYTNRRYASPAQ